MRYKLIKRKYLLRIKIISKLLVFLIVDSINKINSLFLYINLILTNVNHGNLELIKPENYFWPIPIFYYILNNL